MRWFLVIVFFAIAVAAGTTPLWWELLGGTQPERLSLLATLVSAIAGLLGVAVAVIGHFAKGNGRQLLTRQPPGGSIFHDKVTAGGDVIGRNKTTVTRTTAKDGHEGRHQ